MNQAARGLNEQQHQNAQREQEEAVRRLQQAHQAARQAAGAAQDEMQQDLLAELRSLLEKMLEDQITVTKETERMNRVVADRKDKTPVRQDELAFKKLAKMELEIHAKGSKVKTMLEQDGSTIVMLAAMVDTMENIRTVADRLKVYKAGQLTQDLEKDIEQSLRDMLEAIKRAQREQEQQQQQQQQGHQGQQQQQQQDQPLIQLSAELKMLKALQLRINHSTRRVDGLRKELKKQDVDEACERLAKRQARVSELTQDLNAKLKADQAARHGGGAPGGVPQF
jgi:hypothetical protein